MGRILKWTFLIVFWGLVAAFLHYTLPKRDIVYVTGVEIKLEQFGENSLFWAAPDQGASVPGGIVERDVRFIDTVQSNGRVKVFRNEDTGYWPPYFKFDSANLQAEARAAVSTGDDPRWVAMRYYGWRLPLFSIYPNAVTLSPVAGPDVRLIPWFNIIFLTLLLAVVWAIWVRWRRFRRRRIDPRLEQIGDAVYDRRAGLSRWMSSWRRRPSGR